MTNKRSRLDIREPKWWDTIAEWGGRQHVAEDDMDELFDLVHAAIHEDSAAMLGYRGGVKGGCVRAQRLSKEERSRQARHAAMSRWRKVRGGQPSPIEQQ